MPSIGTRIEALLEQLKLGGTNTNEVRSDLEIARALAHQRVVDQKSDMPTPLADVYPDLTFPFDEPLGPIYHSVPERKPLSPAGSLEAALGSSTTSVITRQRVDPDIGPDGYYSAAANARIDAAKMSSPNLGKDDTRERAIVGSRRRTWGR
jgi:hypothetical protein